MKLFHVTYQDDEDYDSYLTTGDSKEEVEKREDKKIRERTGYSLACWISEINSVEGFKVHLEKIEDEVEEDTFKYGDFGRFQLTDGHTVVKMIGFDNWEVKTIRERDGIEEIQPIQYFMDNYFKL
ncbi:hypothetical protein [Oceanobacillus kimchii]|uniref:YopX protein domain-containing protein n=1 Tax=Oceanobacillus kimchii TaxID=746691 RepID=A0ABQ5TKI9_9BACI|nr:hypothetical protein [Oceanobacillus kimchii]GLO66209.1 hypothetical protein MACH08_19930 [Oceanobacillus kimchii]